MKRIKIQIDQAHSLNLLRGQSVAIKVPAGAGVIQLQLTKPDSPGSFADSFAKVLDVFFNGRPA